MSVFFDQLTLRLAVKSDVAKMMTLNVDRRSRLSVLSADIGDFMTILPDDLNTIALEIEQVVTHAKILPSAPMNFPAYQLHRGWHFATGSVFKWDFVEGLTPTHEIRIAFTDNSNGHALPHLQLMNNELPVLANILKLIVHQWWRLPREEVQYE